jgi:DNA-binding transcriptional LysR family regulator
MMHMDITDVRAFVAVAENGSISRAATELRLTQPALTRRIQRLEAAVGVALIDRRKRPVTLTPVGVAAIERCRRIVSMTDELRDLSRDELLPSREIRIGVANALAELTFSGPLEQLRRKFPNLVLRLYGGWSRDLLGRVKSGALDAAVILLPQDESVPADVSGTELGREHLAFFASRLRQWKRRAVRDLGDIVWVVSPEGCAARESLRGELARAGLPLRVAVETYNHELQLALVARNVGLGLVPSRLLERSRSRSLLQIVTIQGLSFPRRIWMVTGSVSSSIRAHVTMLGSSLAKLL